MSRTIDERVVSMQFDNAQFEKNVQTSLSTVDKLKQSLNFTGASKGLENVNAAARNCNMSGLSGAVDTVHAKFSALEVMGVTALANITNSAVNAGKRFVSSFTIDPIKTGLDEYETQINAVQTILANTESKGTTLNDVNGALDALNTYADKTIYNFTEMTRNIGTFTAAGVDLDTSVNAIQGIANLAAVSGSTSQQASTAMYQLSQALSSGTVKLMDWNSVVNAGMGGQVFQDALKETARVHGIAIDEMIEENGSFRETLQEGWLTSDILTETLSKFTMGTEGLTEAEIEANRAKLKSIGYTDEQIDGIFKLGDTATNAATKVKTFTQLMDTLKESAQSGWTQTWEILIGDFEEAKNLWTKVSDVFGGIINSSSEARNKLLTGWAEGGGRDMMMESFANVFKALVNVIKPIKEAFREIFPPTTSEQLLKITESIRSFTEKLILSDAQSEKLKSTFKGLFAVLDIIVTVVKAVVGGVVKLIGNITSLGNGLLGVTGSLGDWLSGLRDSIKESNVFEKAIDKIVGVLQKVIDKFKEAAGFLKRKLAMPGWEAFLAIVGGIWKIIQKVGSAIAKVGSSIGDTLSSAFKSGDIGAGLDILNGGIFAAILIGVKRFVGNLRNAFKDVGGLIDGVSGILDSVRGCFEAYQQNLKANVLLKIASAIGILAVALLIIASIEPRKLTASLAAITALFADLMGAMAIFGKLGKGMKNALRTSTVMVAMATAVLILAAALKTVSDLEWDELGRGLAGIAGLMAVVIVASEKMSSDDDKTFIKGTTRMVIMAAALKIMASVCKDLSTLSWEGLAKAITSIGAILLIFAGFQKIMKAIKPIRPKKMLASATSLFIIGVALEIFSDVCKKFGNLEWEDLAKAGAAITGILALAAGFALLSGLSKKGMTKSSISLTFIGIALEIFSDVCKKFGNLEWEELAKAGAAITGILALAAGFALLSGLAYGMLGSSVALTFIGVALEIFSDVCKKFGNLEWKELVKAGVAIAGVLALAAGFALLSDWAYGIIGSSAALLIMAGSLAILTPVLKALGSMSWGDIAKGLITIAAAFAVIGVAGLLLGPVVPAMLGLAGAVALFGVACLGVGVGVAALATGLLLLASIGTGALLSLIGLIPAVAQEIGNAIIVLCNVIAEGAPAIGNAIKAVILTLMDVLVECTPVIADGLLKLVVAVLAALSEYTPQIVDYLFQFLIGLLDGIAKNLPDLIQSAVDVIMAFFSGVVDALRGIDTETLLEGIAGIGLMSALMAALSAVAGLTPGAMTGVLGMGAVIAELALVLAAIGGLAQIPGLEWLISEGASMMQQIGNAIGGMIGGIVGGLMEGISASLPQIGTDLSNFMINLQPFIEGAKTIDPAMLTGVKTIAQIILTLTAANILDGLTSWLTGGSSLSSFAKDLVPFGQAMADFSAIVSGHVDEAAVNSAANAGKIMAEMAHTLPNSGGVVGFFTGENDMGDFAAQLVPFGEAIRDFSAIVSGNVDENSVVAAANAGKAMSEMAHTLPNSGGVVGFFTGENDMGTFAAQLVPFGEAIRDFSTAVSGNIDENAVIAAANAGKAMSEMAHTLPNSGGVVGFFTGENDMGTFAAQLVPFGRALRDFSAAVGGNIDENAVVAAANAGMMMSRMASTIPNTGGLVSWFTGSNDIDGFGKKLISFGGSISKFSESVSGKINEEAVSAAANAGRTLVELSSGLEKTGGLKQFFGGEKDLGDFGKQICTFGEKIAQFSGKVSGIDAGQLTTVVRETNQLLGLAKGASEVEFTGLLKFSASLTALANAGIEDFISAFTNATSRVAGAISSMITTGVGNAVSQSALKVKLSFTSLTSDMISATDEAQDKFKSAGLNAILKFGSGITSGKLNVSSIFSVLLDDLVSAAESYYSDFKSAGKYVTEGFADGITAQTFYAEAAASAMAEAAKEAAEEALRIKSPSKEFYAIGAFAGEGMITALKDYGAKSYDAGSDMAGYATKGVSEAISSVSSLLSDDLDAQPTIRPILDLSDVESGVDKISGMLSMNPSVGVLSNVEAISSSRNTSSNNSNDDVVAAIKDLGDTMTKQTGNSYTFGNITYSDDSEIAELVQTLVRAILVERRT